METDTLKCQKIEIVDQNGKCRIMMYAETDKSVILLMGKKNPVLQISSSEQNPVELHIMDEDGAVRLTMGMFGNGDVGLTVRDAKSFPRVMVGYEGVSDKGEIRCDGKSLIITKAN